VGWNLRGQSPVGGEALVCRTCARPLELFPDSRPILFHCEEAHFFTVADLLEELIPRDLKQLAVALRAWEERALALYRLAGRALANGHVFVAADLQEAGRRIEERARSLRPLLPSVVAKPSPGP
jgi:hypothetical protein